MDKSSELKAAAMAATPGPWFVHEKPCEDGNYGIDTSDNEWTAEAVVWWGFARESIWREEDARFIAAANPAVVLELLAELEAKDKRIAELEAETKVWESAALKHLSRAEEAEKRLPILEQDKLRLNEIINSEANRADEAEKRLATPIKIVNYDEFFICHVSGASDDYCKGWVDGRNAAARDVGKAGFTVEDRQ